MPRTFLGTEILQVGSAKLVNDLDELYAGVGTGGGGGGIPRDAFEGTIQHVGTTSGGGAGTTQATTLNSQWQDGDHAILTGTINVVDATVNTPTGWTAHPNGGNIGAGGSLQHFFFYKRLVAGDTAPTLSNSLGATKNWAWICSIYRGGSPALPVGGSAHQGVSSAVSSLAAPSVTPDRDNVKLIITWTNNSTTVAGTDLALPASMRERAQVESSGSTKRPVVLGDENILYGETLATGTRTATSTAAANTGWHAFVFALAPDTQPQINSPRIIPAGRGGLMVPDAGMTGPVMEMPGTLRAVATRFHTPSSSGNIRYQIKRVDRSGTETVVATITVEEAVRVERAVNLGITYGQDDSFLLDPVDGGIGTGAAGWSVVMLCENDTP